VGRTVPRRRSSASALAAYWSNEAPKIFEPFSKDFKKLETDLFNVFEAGRTTDIGTALGTVGKDVLALIIDAVRTLLAEGVQPLAKIILGSLRATLTMALPVPFFSPLYKHALGTTKEPTPLDIFALILAICTTILGKLLGHPPLPELSPACWT
jgi:hypothetical protein